MKKKLYEKPTMNVVVIQHTQMLMTSVEPEGVKSQRSTYGDATEQTWN